MDEDRLIPPISPEVALAALRERLPALDIRNIAYLGGGSFATFRAGADLIVKFPKERRNDADFMRQFELETRLFPRLAEMVQPHGIPAPRWHLPGPSPHFAGPIFGYGYLAGEQIARLSLNEAEQMHVAGMLGDFLGKLHSLPLDDAIAAGIAHATSEDVRAGWIAQYDADQREIFPRLETDERAWLDAMYERFLAKDIVPDVALIHGDFGPENVLLLPERGRLHVIDLEDLHIGPVAADFCLWRGCYGPAFLDAMLAAYHRPVDQHFLDVMSFCYDRVPLIYFRHGFTHNAPAFITFGQALLHQRMGN